MNQIAMEEWTKEIDKIEKGSSYIPLDVKSDYSIKESVAKIQQLVEKAKYSGMKALALTDRTLAGSLEFYRLCCANGIKPIIGQSIPYMGEETIVLCKDEEAFKILCRRSLEITGFDSDNSVFPFSKEEAAHFICISKHADSLKEIFGENLYAYIDFTKIASWSEKDLSTLDKSKSVIINPVRFIERTDNELLAAIRGDRIENVSGSHFVYEDEIRAELEKLNCIELLENTSKIAAQIGYIFPKIFFEQEQFNQRTIESFPVDENEIESFKELVFSKAANRFKILTEEITNRLDYEISIIKENHFESIFLMYSKIIEKCNEKGIMHGPGRGSPVGSLVAYVLGITKINPLEHGLLFERFINPVRKIQPDFDIDFEHERVNEVIEIVKELYGEQNVSRIATYAKARNKIAIIIAAKYLGYSRDEYEDLIYYWPSNPRISINNVKSTLENLTKENLSYYFESYETAERLKKLISEKKCSDILNLASRLEGIYYDKQVHACGYIITKNPVTDYLPVETVEFNVGVPDEYGDVETDSCIASSFDMDNLYYYGIYKNDFLGLHALSKTKAIINEIEKNHNIRIDLDSIPLDDEKTLELFRNADTKDIFYFESEGMKRNLAELHPDSFNDLVALSSLYRPGPMDYIPQFIQNKKNKNKNYGVFSNYSGILDETYGIIVYQEQFMQLVQEICGCSLAEADIMRRGMGKKKPDSVMAAKNIFVNGAVQKGISEEIAEEMFFELMNFSAYAFNKSHSVAYALIGWQQAYLKAHYPDEFVKFGEEWGR